MWEPERLYRESGGDPVSYRGKIPRRVRCLRGLDGIFIRKELETIRG